MCEHSQSLTTETCSVCIANKNAEDQDMVKSTFEELRDEANDKTEKPDNKWTDVDIQFLRDNVDKMSNAEMGEHLGRTAAAVSFRRSTLGILKKARKNKQTNTTPLVPKTLDKLDFDPDKYYLGKICKHGHEYQDTGKGLRKNNRTCYECNKPIPSERSLTVDFSRDEDLLKELKELAETQLRTVENQALWMLRMVQKHDDKLEK